MVIWKGLIECLVTWKITNPSFLIASDALPITFHLTNHQIHSFFICLKFNISIVDYVDGTVYTFSTWERIKYYDAVSKMFKFMPRNVFGSTCGNTENKTDT